MPNQHKEYTEKEKILAAETFAVTRSMDATSKMLKIPAGTLTGWRNKRWKEGWKETVERCQREYEERVRGKLQRIVEAALDQTLDSLEKGDERVNSKSGRKIRVKCSAKDAATITGIISDKLWRLEGKPLEGDGEVNSMEEKMDQLRKLQNQHLQKEIESGGVTPIKKRKS